MAKKESTKPTPSQPVLPKVDKSKIEKYSKGGKIEKRNKD